MGHIYDASGRQIARVDGDEFYDGFGRLIGRSDGEHLYNSSGLSQWVWWEQGTCQRQASLVHRWGRKYLTQISDVAHHRRREVERSER